MIRDISSEEDIQTFSRQPQTGSERTNIRRIEDLPDLDLVGEASIEWIVEKMIAKGALHMLTSEPGAGKSTLTAAICYAVSMGRPFAGRSTTKCSVLILDAENPGPAIVERFQRLRIRTHEVFKVWGQWVGQDPPSAGGVTVLEWVARCNPKPLIVVDSVIAFHPGAENDSNETRQYMAQYRLLTALGATVILLHHTGKSETSKEYRGSSDYKASIDIGYKLTSLGDGTRLSWLELRPFKQRFSVDPLIRLSYKDGVFNAEQTAGTKGVAERLTDLLKLNPGVTKAEFEALAGADDLGRNRARDFLESGVTAGSVRRQVGPKNRHLHFWVNAAPEE